MPRTTNDPDMPTLRIVKQAIELSPHMPELAAALAELLPPRRVRELLAPMNDGRLAIAVAIAERALESCSVRAVAALVSALAEEIGCELRVVAQMVVENHRGAAGARTAALDLVAAIEKVSQRTVRERIKGHELIAGWGLRNALRRAS